MGVSIDGMLACGGGGSSKLWRQMLADTYNCAVRTVVSKEGPGAGRCHPRRCGGAGLYPSVQEGCRRVIRLNARRSRLRKTCRSTRRSPYVHEVVPALKGLLQGACCAVSRVFEALCAP